MWVRDRLDCLWSDEDFAVRRYGRPVRLGKNPTRPKTRSNTTETEARRLLEHLALNHPGLLDGPQMRALRQILVQNYYRDTAGRLRRRDDDGALPPSAHRIVRQEVTCRRANSAWADTAPTRHPRQPLPR
ncbi:hypothetical protein [Kitasatospora sp. NPDC050543]|uniref:hypothetical protein n=1 Tax=Kitasatospora sp. NPDC050543 TaxID=3364054 RepID=UPI00378FDAE8